MNHAAYYKTRQKDVLVSYLKSLHGSHVTVNDILGYFSEEGIAVGITTIYRHLERMVADGEVKKYLVDGVSGAHFEYVGDGGEDDREQCFYLKCEKCRKLIHFQCKELEQIQRHLSDTHGFDIDAPKTVFYGTCRSCSEHR